jgi:2-haloalkanoic acid dehalogenase type II
MDYNQYKFLSFDCYGTLIDWETGIWKAFQRIILLNKRTDLFRKKVLSHFAELEAEQQTNTPSMLYPEVLYNVHQQFAKQNNLQSNEELDKEFGNSVPYWPIFADTADALRKLKTQFKLIILSNVNNAGFADSSRWLGVEFDAIYTAEQIGSYKPNTANFEYMLKNLKETFGINKYSILHVAQSLFHDHVPAKTLGMKTIWIDRQNLRKAGNWGATKVVENSPKADAIFENLMSFAQTAVYD